MIMLQHISPHFVAGSTKTQKSAASSGEDSSGTSHERTPSPTERDVSPNRNSEPSRSSTPTPMKHSNSEQSCDESSDEPKIEPRRRLQTAAMKKAMDTSPVRPVQVATDVEEVEEEEQDEDRSRPDSRCDSPPPPEILTQRVSISQRLCDKLNGAIIRRALKQEQDQREPVVVLNHQRLLLRDRMETASPPLVEEGEDDEEEEEEEDTDSNVPLDLSLNAEEKLKREQTELFLRQHKKEDGSESDDSGGPGEDRGRAYKKSLMKRYRKYRRGREIDQFDRRVERVSIY